MVCLWRSNSSRKQHGAVGCYGGTHKVSETVSNVGGLRIKNWMYRRKKSQKYYKKSGEAMWDHVKEIAIVKKNVKKFIAVNSHSKQVAL